jgi:quercetin dioxygenase-like cupin family protein
MKAKPALILVLLMVLVTALYAQAAMATPPSGITREVLAESTIALRAPVSAQLGSDVVVQHVTIAPGGTTGWHSHPGAAVILVKSGIFNLYRDVNDRCRHNVFVAGSGFVERAGQVHIGRNESATTPVEIYATYFNVPAGTGSVVIDQPDPGVCHFGTAKVASPSQ